MPALVLTADRRVASIRTAQALGASYAIKAELIAPLEAFFQAHAVNRYGAAVEHAARRMSKRQRQVTLCHAFGGTDGMCRELQISKSTMRTHRQRIGVVLDEPLDAFLNRLRRRYLRDGMV